MAQLRHILCHYLGSFCRFLLYTYLSDPSIAKLLRGAQRDPDSGAYDPDRLKDFIHEADHGTESCKDNEDEPSLKGFPHEWKDFAIQFLPPLPSFPQLRAIGSLAM